MTAAVRKAKRLAVLVMGGTVVAIGLALVVLPGPGFLVVPAGLTILATEFVWAKRMLDRLKKLPSDLHSALKGRTP